MYELVPRYSSKKSFYGKAKIKEIEDDEAKGYLLYSYGTLVAIYSEYKNINKKIYNYIGHFSMTTTSHQKEFFKQYGLNDSEIKEVIKKGELEIEE